MNGGVGLQISLLGGFEVRTSDSGRVAFATRKAEALLAMLAVQPGS